MNKTHSFNHDTDELNHHKQKTKKNKVKNKHTFHFKGGRTKKNNNNLLVINSFYNATCENVKTHNTCLLKTTPQRGNIKQQAGPATHETHEIKTRNIKKI